MISIVDYGLGNIEAIANIYRRLDIPVAIASDAQALASAERIVLPGVGAFDWAMSRLEASGMRQTLDRLVLQDRKPVIGICVGMQMLARRSDEGTSTGLGWIDADVRLFDDARFTGPTHLPHMGWNDVRPAANQPLFAGLESDARFYFLHSYFIEPHDPSDILATADYGGSFCCAVRRGNVMGVQFHPEKSHQWGIRLLKNFAEL
ncbi:imidazole glycerol phosphate synthase subunit HisH [Piscinibacter terrae]|uniref:Imidazole glycerol phosphate synthase subunit HisH n=1 Tax=Piscinibacter terrae TaxID=2496871 RepID=A0A3N7HJC4_9BURK|nr:imidazole glycerol phosphate synthase subunit HisH [Albitalea terrae]RQP21613.1 imidazole glycerol phosphate synthase subunit HisH [Albitalea terrae]